MLNEKKMRKIMETLATVRPIFHSEADFKFALAWEIQKKCPRAEVRLEYPFRETQSGKQKTTYIDIVVIFNRRNEKNVIPIELKYYTAACRCEIRGEHFGLKNHGSSTKGDPGKGIDAKRIQKFVNKTKNNSPNGFIVSLNNARSDTSQNWEEENWVKYSEVDDKNPAKKGIFRYFLHEIRRK